MNHLKNIVGLCLLIAVLGCGLGMILDITWLLNLGVAFARVVGVIVVAAFAVLLTVQGIATRQFLLVGAVALAILVALYAAFALGFYEIIAAAVLGAIGGLLWRRKVARRQRRLENLPTWEKTELGDAASLFDPNFSRVGAEDPGANTSCNSPVPRLLQAVTKPLSGASICEYAPGIWATIYGTRVAYVVDAQLALHSSHPEGATTALPAPRTPGNRTAVFVFEAGDELQSSAQQWLKENVQTHPDESNTLPETQTIITPEQPHELASFLVGGAPANSDARHGRAADAHQRNLEAIRQTIVAHAQYRVDE